MTETQQSGYTLVQQGGLNATCTNVSTPTPPSRPPTAGPSGSRSTPPTTAAISCTVYNQAPNPPATVQVDKQWIVNGATFANGAQPPGLSAQPTLNGATRPFGVGGPRVHPGPAGRRSTRRSRTHLPLCTVTSQTAHPGQRDAPVDAALPFSATLLAGANTYTITNVVTCTSSLQLTKTVVGGTAAADGVEPAGDRARAGRWPARTARPASPANVTAGVIYPLAESGGNPNYVQDLASGRRPDPRLDRQLDLRRRSTPPAS